MSEQEPHSSLEHYAGTVAPTPTGEHAFNKEGICEVCGFHDVEAHHLYGLLTDCRRNLKHWAARYAEAEHARKAQREALILIQRIDEQLLKL